MTEEESLERKGKPGQSSLRALMSTLGWAALAALLVMALLEVDALVDRRSERTRIAAARAALEGHDVAVKRVEEYRKALSTFSTKVERATEVGDFKGWGPRVIRAAVEARAEGLPVEGLLAIEAGASVQVASEDEAEVEATRAFVEERLPAERLVFDVLPASSPAERSPRGSQ